MKVSSKTVFGVQIGGILHTLFTVRLKLNGELMITHPLGASYAGDLSSGESGALVASENSPKFIQERLSVHLSQNSRDYNTVKRTSVRSDGTELTSVAITNAVKKKEGYAFMFGGRWYNIAMLPAAAPECRRKTISKLDPNQETFIGTILLAHAGAVFPEHLPVTENITVTQERFGGFRIVVLSSIFPVPSHKSGTMSFGITAPAEKAGNDQLLMLAMNASSTEATLGLYREFVYQRMTTFIKEILPTVKNASLAARLRQVFASLSLKHIPLSANLILNTIEPDTKAKLVRLQKRPSHTPNRK